jgi:HK97 family phage major capsid protein
MNHDELIKIDIALRSLSEKVKNGSMTATAAEDELNKLKTQKRELQQQIAQRNFPAGEGAASTLADMRSAIIEKRAVVLNGTGAINQVKELQKELSDKKEILNLVKYFYGANASTLIPILSPGPVTPGQYAEGATNVALDNQAVLGAKEIKAHAFVTVLPVSAETVHLGSVNLETELPEIFAESFGDALARQVVTGDGTGFNFDGIFNNLENTINCGATGTPKMADLVNLAIKVRDKCDDAIIIMHPSIYSGIMANATTGVSVYYKEELIKSKTIEGIRVLLTGYAPSAISTGSTVAVAGRMSDYAFAMASELMIEPIKKVGDTNVYYQATIFANGCKIINKNFVGLSTI